MLTVDGPLSGTADTSRIRYDGARKAIGTISPDPDGSGALKHRAVRNSYTNGLLTKVETGTVNSQSDSDWAAFSSLQEAQTEYDGNARPVKRKLVAGSTIYALTQASYDALGRPECTAQRMNGAIFSSITTAACSLGTAGSGGPDRIVKTFYDAAGRVTKVTSAYGVSGEQADDVTSTYTSNGLVQTVTDAENRNYGDSALIDEPCARTPLAHQVAMSGTVPGFQTSLPNRGVGMPATYRYGDLGGNRDSG